MWMARMNMVIRVASPCMSWTLLEAFLLQIFSKLAVKETVQKKCCCNRLESCTLDMCWGQLGFLVQNCLGWVSNLSFLGAWGQECFPIWKDNIDPCIPGAWLAWRRCMLSWQCSPKAWCLQQPEGNTTLLQRLVKWFIQKQNIQGPWVHLHLL